MNYEDANAALHALRECSYEDYKLRKDRNLWSVVVQAPNGKWVALTNSQINLIIGL